MTRGLIVPAIDNTNVQHKEFVTLADYQAGVGGFIEAIEIEALGITIYLNEEGRARQLPFNSRVTFLHWFHIPQARNRSMLVGDAVIIGGPDAEGENQDVPEEILYLFSPEARFIVEARIGAGRWVRHSSELTYSEAAFWAMLLAEKSPVPLEVKVKSI